MAINSGLADPSLIGVTALAIDPVTPATIYAGTCGDEGEGGLFKSTDGGESWTPRFVPCIRVLLIDPTAPATIYAGTQSTDGGVYKSANGGTSWTAINDGLTRSPEGVSLALHPSAPTTIYAGTAYGIFKSTTGGTSWTAIHTGLTSSISPPALAIDPSAPTTLYAGTNRSVFKSTDGGAGWNASSAGLTATVVNAVVIDPSLPATLYAGTTEGGVFKSTDGAVSWTAINAGLASELTATPNLTVRALVIDPTNPATLYAGTGGGGAGIRKSTNAGASWTAVNSGLTFDLFFSLAIDPINPTTLYAGTFGSNNPIGLFKSTNGGGNWTAISIGLTNTVVSALAIDPSDPKTLYAGTRGGGVLKSTNGGTDLTAINTGLTNAEVNALAIDPSASATLYAGTSGGVFKSTNGGENWTAVSTGLTNTVVSALAIDPSATETLYAGTRGGGVFKSTNGGSAWTAFNAGLHNPTVNAVAIDPVVPTRLYAGTGGGVWQLTAPTTGTITALLPASAHSPGVNGAFYTTDVAVANAGALAASFTLKFLGNNQDGSDGPEKSFNLDPGKSRTFVDVLGSEFNETSNFGAIRITSNSSTLDVVSVTSTPGFGGTFGQTIPAVSFADLISAGSSRSILYIREGDGFRSNLILASGSFVSTDVEVALVSPAGATLATKTYSVPPNGMTQINRVVRDMGVLRSRHRRTSRSLLFDSGRRLHRLCLRHGRDDERSHGGPRSARRRRRLRAIHLASSRERSLERPRRRLLYDERRGRESRRRARVLHDEIPRP